MECGGVERRSIDDRRVNNRLPSSRSMKQYLKRSGGFAIGYAMVMSMLLLFSTIAYLKWQTSGSGDAHRKVAEIQAYYTAQAAVISVPIAYLREHRTIDLIYPAVMTFPDGSLPEMGEYRRPMITAWFRQGGNGMGDPEWSSNRKFICSAVGIVKYRDGMGNEREVRRMAKARVDLRLPFSYFSLTEYETSRFGENMWFFGGDSIFGDVHSNHDLYVHPGAFFGGRLSSSGRIFYYNGSAFPNHFYFEHAPRVEFPDVVESIRYAGASGGIHFQTSNRAYTFGLEFVGSNATLWRWQTGCESHYGDPRYAIGSYNWNVAVNCGIYCDGELWVKGVVRGKLGIAAAGSIRIMGDLVVDGNSGYPECRVPLNNPNMITLATSVAEPGPNQEDPWTGIIIANTPENGRDNGISEPISNYNRRDIAINAYICAERSSFTFEDQNDTWSPYQGPTPDERGFIYFTGAITQYRKGYLHRSNHGNTGYFKRMKFDKRFEDSFAPFFTGKWGVNVKLVAGCSRSSRRRMVGIDR